ncbi:hypothetical protein PFZ79_002751 [Enterococcus hirae]|nr:hypothetical protein [Enterococcus hirae]
MGETDQAISELHEEKHYSITNLCQLAGIARSSYYKWLKWKPSKKELENRKLAKEIKKKRQTYVKSTEVHVAENVLNRKFIAEKSNQNGVQILLN